MSVKPAGGSTEREPSRRRVSSGKPDPKTPFRTLSIRKWEPDFEEIVDGFTSTWPPRQDDNGRAGN